MERRWKAAELYRSGLSLVEVGKRLGVSDVTILRYLVKIGVKRRPLGAHNKGRVSPQRGAQRGERPELKERNDAMRAMRKDGATLKEIGNAFGISAPGVHYILSRKEGER